MCCAGNVEMQVKNGVLTKYSLKISKVLSENQTALHAFFNYRIVQLPCETVASYNYLVRQLPPTIAL